MPRIAPSGIHRIRRLTRSAGPAQGSLEAGLGGRQSRASCSDPRALAVRLLTAARTEAPRADGSRAKTLRRVVTRSAPPSPSARSRPRSLPMPLVIQPAESSHQWPGDPCPSSRLAWMSGAFERQPPDSRRLGPSSPRVAGELPNTMRSWSAAFGACIALPGAELSGAFGPPRLSGRPSVSADGPRSQRTAHCSQRMRPPGLSGWPWPTAEHPRIRSINCPLTGVVAGRSDRFMFHVEHPLRVCVPRRATAAPCPNSCFPAPTLERYIPNPA
jgi:hypothetical protein